MSHLKHASKLRNVRRARMLSQAQLADIAKVSQQTISKAERGMVPLSKDLQELIAVILATPRQELFPEPESQQAAS